MWKMVLLTFALATVILGGCTGKDTATDTPLKDAERDVEQGVDNMEKDVRNGVNDVEGAVEPDRNHNDIIDEGVKSDGVINENGINSGTPPSVNGVDGEVNDTNGVNNKDIIEEKDGMR